ncbi:unnamed protein product [Caenorhabditis auriculariae]|uniref:BAG domain-containing protein n=1 Tax=Caenorhabditis auriculariae TaxID=2777116 RepID=A0A8S1HDW0_9PELO|nr:unnamed protein product [Caenorhabditis auriculariae]
MVVVNIPIKILGRPSTQPQSTQHSPAAPQHSRSNSTSSAADGGFVVTSSTATNEPNFSSNLINVPVQRSRPVSRQSQVEEPERPPVIPLPAPEQSKRAEPEQEAKQESEQPQAVSASHSTEGEFQKLDIDSQNAQKEEGAEKQDGASRRRRLMRNQSVVDFNAKTIVALDKIEQQVELLRKTANQLEIEKEQILRALTEISVHSYMLRLAECDREEIVAVTDRLTKRTNSVQVVIETPRNEEQKKALENATQMIDEFTNQMTDNAPAAKQMLQTYLNACSSEETSGAINANFLKVIIECTADDQKRVKRRLENLLSQIENAQKTTAVLLEDE